MIQTLNEKIKVFESNDIVEIEYAITSLLYVPDQKLKLRIIQELIDYIKNIIVKNKYKLKILITSQNSEFTGIVMCIIHPTYTSYGRKCGTFGWLLLKKGKNSFEVCKKLIENCETFIQENKIKKIRGNINFPKGIGGLGIQAEGFHCPMLFGVAFNDPDLPLIDFLEKLGYKKESEYICMEMTQKTWAGGRKIDKGIRLGYYTIEEFWEHKEDFHNLISKSFQGSLPMPDASGRYRLEEIIKTYEEIPKSHFKIKNNDFNPQKYSDIPEFQEAWISCDIEKCVMGAPLAFDRLTGELIGGILAIPNIYQGWLGEPISQMNVDTVMVDKKYAGRGIFSALNNIGQLGTNLNGISYFEGTSIWYNNPDAIKAIFPHGKLIRKHYVMQKRIKVN